MRVGMQLPHFRPSTAGTMRSWFAETAQAAEENGFYSLWVMDHFFQLDGWLGPPEDPMVEGYTTLGYLAGVTDRIKLGLMVGGVIYRHPSVVVKAVSTLDVLSGGRAYFGIGAAWNEHESNALGIRFPPLKERFQQLEDILRLAHQMWRGDTSEFAGHVFTVPYPHNNPQPVSQPHPPILVGGGGEKKTLRLVAQYADGTNLFGRLGLDELGRKLDILKGHCAAVGRDYDEIEKTVLNTYNPAEITLSELVSLIEDYRKLGFTHAIFNVNGDYTPDVIKQIGQEVVVAVKDL